jgi:hypothetical protein
VITPEQGRESSEPVSAAPGQPEAGSSQFATAPVHTPSVVRDLLRALVVAGLFALCAASPGAGLVLLPFVPAILAMRLLRPRPHLPVLIATGVLAFLAGTLAASTLDWASPDVGSSTVAAVLVAALGSTVVLGLVHAHGARLDPVVDGAAEDAWPEPLARTGFLPTLVTWCVLAVVVVGVSGVERDQISDGAHDAVRRAFATYDRECDTDGILASRTEYCENLLDRRDRLVEFVDDHPLELTAAALAIFLLCAAGTTHLALLWRSRRAGLRARGLRPLRELEVHWSAAYVAAAGVFVLLAGPAAGSSEDLVRAIGIGLATLGAGLMAAQGIGLAAWSLDRRAARRGTRIVLVLICFVLPQISVPVLVALGMTDMAARPRRRAAERVG